MKKIQNGKTTKKTKTQDGHIVILERDQEHLTYEKCEDKEEETWHRQTSPLLFQKSKWGLYK